MVDSNDTATIQSGPWWSRILTNRNAVIAAVALYLVYFITGLFGTNLAHLAAQVDKMDVSLSEHREADRAHYTRLEELLIRLNDQAILQTRLEREICWNSATNNEQRRKCISPDVR